MVKEFEQLKLDNQLCFLLYAASREMTKQYKPLLEALDVTYPQYLVLLLLWEQDEMSVKKMGELLYLDSGTLTPMLKRMEQQGLVTRERTAEDQRSVTVTLTEKGHSMKNKASGIPARIFELSGNNEEEYQSLKASLTKLLNILHQHNE
ncbi:MarR family winged helix-turn-helix transcriptional regulator [Heyndrickxia acidicola]|uniref:HTH-type transcriptional regulator SarZ n=1 Tax=Heyndrickxia acidicola TaxID=209389 RepID=A0ABU6MD64_9BACI|nr:MarR family transcriptional regulator [Heyndrickxia acidicola]MED1202460.1 MarR family transcriptional regulator [Heyndrickxia acidicola]